MEFKEKKREIQKKYEDIIKLIAIENDVDLGVAYDMFKENVMHNGKYPYFNELEAREDFTELRELAEKDKK